MLSKDPSLSKTLNPSLFLLTPFSNPLRKTLTLKPFTRAPKTLSISSSSQFQLNSDPNFTFSRQIPHLRRDLRSFAGRSKKKAGGGPSPGRIEGNADSRREVRENARRKSKRLAESNFYRLKNQSRKYADNFTEDELQQIGLGYDRMVRFMEKDDPNLRHPHDWYKYGEFGPYSWRGVVVGQPVRGRFTDERVTIIGEVKDQEEWEKIEQFEMSQDFGKRLGQLDRSKGRKYFWVFVRHPRWRLSDFPWQQWTLVCEVVVEGEKQRLDKWSLMGRLGNLTRSLITKCAAWFRPDIIYVKRPVYQCRFEPQDDFFKVLTPFLDPKTEEDYLFELERADGSVEMCTYFGGLCKIVKVNQKAIVDDVVKGFEKLSDEEKSRCLGFLLKNHPVQLLHPYTKEWKAKLEEWELGCDAPDDDNEGSGINVAEKEFTEWVEDDEVDNEEDNVVMEMEDGDESEFEDDDEEEDDGDDELGVDAEELSEEEDEKYWEEEFEKAVSSSDAMEKLAKQSVEATTEYYKKQLRTMEGYKNQNLEDDEDGDGDETAMRGKRPTVSAEEWKVAGYGPWRKRIKKSKIPPQLFLRAAVRPFTYRNLVKEIVLTRHGIVDGDF
ncbi:uncharacterized protein LOC103926876 [Pyrus x bretschneideri]|uniref:uncharacterized protein LOC103926876 n=1 Tax=Pyrus x bretschneideri TaxID=225117 RepID=UPI0020304302|nr:uncharacterized protein LOC103926876 [Pyrus x bretschneideri]